MTRPAARLRAWALYAYALIVFVVATLPLSQPVGPGGDKLHHFAAFFVMAVLLRLAHPGLHAVWVFVGCTLYGALIEVVQVFLPFRCAELADGLANAAGAALGLAAWWGYRRLRYGSGSRSR